MYPLRTKSFTFLREPAKQIESSYYFVRNSRHKDEELTLAGRQTRKYNFKDWLKFVRDGGLQNKTLGLSGEGKIQPNGNENIYARCLLGRAATENIPNLDFADDGPEMQLIEERLNSFTAIGIVEDFERSMISICKACNIPPPARKELISKNRASESEKSERDPIDDQTRELLQQISVYDQKIYRLGKELHMKLAIEQDLDPTGALAEQLAISQRSNLKESPMPDNQAQVTTPKMTNDIDQLQLGATQELVLIGCGAMAVETAAYIADMNNTIAPGAKRLILHGVVANTFDRLQDIETLIGYPIITYENEDDIPDRQAKKYVICIGSNTVVAKYIAQLDQKHLALQSIIHPTSYISKTAKLEDGVIIAPHTYIGPSAQIGRGTILNVNATIGHDCIIGAGCIVSPHVNLNGAANAEQGVFFGAGVIVDPGVKIGKFSKIISGATLKKDLKEGHLFISDANPAVKMFDIRNGANLFGGIR